MSLRKVSQLTSWTSYLLLQEKCRIPRRYRRTVATLLIFVTKNAWHSGTKQKNQQSTKCMWVGRGSWQQVSAEFDRWPWSGHRSLWSVQCCPNLQRVGKSIFIGYSFAFFRMVVNMKHTLKEQIGKEGLHGYVEMGIRDGDQDNKQVSEHSDLVHGEKMCKYEVLQFWFLW